MANSNNSSTNFQPWVPDWAKPIITAASQKYNVPATLLSAMIQQESGYQTHAVSSAGAQGIAQFMPGTAKSYGINPFNPAQAIDGMAHYMRNSLDALGGNVPAAVAAYNSGLGAVQQYGGIPPYQETQNYVRSIMAMSGMSGVQPQGQAAPQQQMPQQQGTGQIPPTQVNNPAGASPMPQMGRQAGAMPSQPQQQQVPGAIQQSIANGINQFAQRRMMPGVMPQATSSAAPMNPQSGGGAAAQSQVQQPVPTSLSTILNNANANAPSLGSSSSQNGATPTPSTILPYLLNQSGGSQ